MTDKTEAEQIRHRAFDEDAVLAALDLARRSGAKSIELGYLRDDVPSREAGWYIELLLRPDHPRPELRSQRVIVEEQAGPVEAADALARRLLEAAACQHCKRPIALAGDSTKTCRWTREGKRWARGCESSSG